MNKSAQIDDTFTLDMFHMFSQTLPCNYIIKKDNILEDFDSDKELRSNEDIMSKKANIPGLSNKRTNRKKNSKNYTFNDKFWAFKKKKKSILIGMMNGAETLLISEFNNIKNNEFKEITQLHLSKDNDFLLVILDFKKILVFQLKLNEQKIQFPKKLNTFWETSTQDLKKKIKIIQSGDYDKIPCLKMNPDNDILVCKEISGLICEVSKISKFLWSKVEKCFYYAIDKDVKKIQFRPNYTLNSNFKKSFNSKLFFSDNSKIKTFDITLKSRVVLILNIKNEIKSINRRGKVLKKYAPDKPVMNIKCFANNKKLNNEEEQFNELNPDFKSVTQRFGFVDKVRKVPVSVKEEANIIISPFIYEYMLILFEERDVLCVNLYNFFYKNIQENQTWLSEDFYKGVCTRMSSLVDSKVQELLSTDENTFKMKKNWYDEYKNIYKDEIEDIEFDKEEVYIEGFNEDYSDSIKSQARQLHVNNKLWDQTEMYYFNNSVYIVFLRLKLVIMINLKFPTKEDIQNKGTILNLIFVNF